jgi:predicted esterase
MKIRPASLLSLLCIHFCLLSGNLQANSEVRDWKMKNGDSLSAEILSVDEKARTIILRNGKGEELTFSLDELGITDHAWVLEWIEMNEELADKVKELGGRLERFEGQGSKFKTGYHVYHPSGDVDPAKPRPLLFLIDPSGNPMRYLLRHIEAAEKTKITAVSAEYFRNRRNLDDLHARFEDLIPLFEKEVPHDPKCLYLGGTSGGAWAAFHIASKLQNHKVAGIYSNVGWLGPDPSEETTYPACRVALVNGDKDYAVVSETENVTRVLQKRGCTVSLFAFEGGHQIPPVSVQLKSFRWLLGETQ